jgi:hypothetical protein
VLTDEADGTQVAAHDVRLDATDWQFEAFYGLYQYLSWHVAPDRRGVDDARIVAEVGEWIGTQVLGPIADALATRTRRRPVTVRVIVPAEAAELLACPLELAHVNGKPLSTQDITLVLQPGPGAGADDTPGTRDRLRVLGLFSLPEGGQPLSLRRERQALVTLIDGIAASGKAADVRVLQYGVTRALLRDVLAEAEGWDIIHISGHGAPGELLLETADGMPDQVSATQLADMLFTAREHVRLITIAACWSAAESVADQRRRLGLPIKSEGNQTPGSERAHPAAASSAPSSMLAAELVSRLDCAVLAMRYPVNDEFAIALTERLYELLLVEGQPLPRALAMTLRELLAPLSEPSAATEQAFPPLSVATPALFGGMAVDLSLTAPERDGPAGRNVTPLKLTRFPPQPERFVGRVAVMARSSAALALRSGVPGVLLHGMPGGGKSACALELAYGHEHAFDRLVWYKAPDDGVDITGALTDLAFVLEQELPGFHMLDALVTEARLTAFLPTLTELVKQRRILIVIGNAESLLTESGQWRDSRWGQVICALTAHNGLGRVILTSRRVPAGLTGLRAEALRDLIVQVQELAAAPPPDLFTGQVSATYAPSRFARLAQQAGGGEPGHRLVPVFDLPGWPDLCWSCAGADDRARRDMPADRQ